VRRCEFTRTAPSDVGRTAATTLQSAEGTAGYYALSAHPGATQGRVV